MSSKAPRKTDIKNRFLVLCEHPVITGGLLRFARMNQVLQELNLGEMYFLPLDDSSNDILLEDTFPRITRKLAKKTKWTATLIPGAGFSSSTIEKFIEFRTNNFGIKIQFILNDPALKEKFLKVNRSFIPDLVIFNNKHWPVGSFTEFYGKQFHTIIGAVDSRFFFPLPYRSHPLNENEWVIGGQLHKNPMPLIEALHLLPPGFKINFFGPDRLDVGRKFSNLIRSSKISLHGLILNDSALLQFYHSVDCIVMTERFAGWSNMVAEAMAAGVPCICTRAGTLDMAFHQETALLLPDNPTAKDIARAISLLKADKDLCHHLTINARKNISKFSWEAYIKNFLNILDEFDGNQHYLYAPSYKLYGKWDIKTRLKGLKPLLDKCKRKTVLDLGAAEGIIAKQFLHNGAEKVDGIEIDAKRVNKAKEVCAEFSNARFVAGELSNLDTSFEKLLDSEYDIILYLGVHHHLTTSTRLSVLNLISKRAKEFIAIRTSSELFHKDNIDDNLKRHGFKVNFKEKEDKDTKLGELRIYKKEQNVFNSFEIKKIPSRQFISFPKSGRTWIRYILTQLGLETYIIFHHDGFEYNDGTYPELNFNISKRLQLYTDQDKIIYLERDPMDVMVSLFHQITGRFKDIFKYQGSISDFIRHEYFGANNLKKFRQMWEDITKTRGFLKITYEAMHQDAFATMQNILTYLELDYDQLALKQAIKNAEFSKMKQVEDSGKFSQPWLRKRQGAPKVRCGKIAGYKDILSHKDIKYLEKIFEVDGAKK